MEREEKTYKVLSMCNFCANDAYACKANRVFSGTMPVNDGKVDSREAVIACDRYADPVTALLSFC